MPVRPGSVAQPSPEPGRKFSGIDLPAELHDLDLGTLGIRDTRGELGIATANNDDGWDGEDRESEEEGGGEQDGKKRDKNRRAQQRFRQRQKAKLQLKEQETLQLQRQVQELQAQLIGLQLNGVSGGVAQGQQLDRMAARCQALQAENRDLRALALRFLEENKQLRAERGAQVAAQPSLPPQLQQQVQQLIQPHIPASLLTGSVLGPKPSWDNPVEVPAIQRAMGARNTVFWNLSSIPWKSSTGSTEVGVPVGINPGGTGANILTKLLNRLADGSTTMLVQLPPGFEHDYLIRADRQVEEGLILAGSLTDSLVNKTYLPGDYCQVLPGCQHGPYLADPTDGCLVFVVTRVSMKVLMQPGL
jgi:hypothetical protein